MKHKLRSDAARQTQAGLEALWDCIARLLARRWIQDQRSQECSGYPDGRKDSANAAAPKLDEANGDSDE
jgi:hypothetical protein